MNESEIKSEVVDAGIIPVQPTGDEGGSAGAAADQPQIEPVDDVQARARCLEPVCGSIIDVGVGFVERRVRLLAERAKINPARIQKLVAAARPEPQIVRAARESLARIIARRTTDVEAIDYLVLIGFASELYMGYSVVAAEIQSYARDQGAAPDAGAHGSGRSDDIDSGIVR